MKQTTKVKVFAFVLIVILGTIIVLYEYSKESELELAPTPHCRTKISIDGETKQPQNYTLSQNYTRAYFTLISSIEYDVGAQILVCRLRHYSPDTPILVLVDDSVSLQSNSFYAHMGAEIIMVSNPCTSIQKLCKEVRSGTYTKLNLWQFDSVQTAVYLDADTIPVRNPEPLFDMLDSSKFIDFAVVGNRGYFNTGVIALRPSLETWHKLQVRLKHGDYEKIKDNPTEQDLLVSHFGTLETTKFINNIYNYRPLHHQAAMSNDAVIVHYIGNPKPWTSILGKETSIKGQKKDSSHLPIWSVQLYQREMELYFTTCHGLE